MQNKRATESTSGYRAHILDSVFRFVFCSTHWPGVCVSLDVGVLWFWVQHCSVARGTVFRTQFPVKATTHRRENKVKFTLISIAQASSFSLRPCNTGAPQGFNKVVKEGMKQRFQ